MLDLTYITVGKIVYAEPRPYMIDPTIEAMRCSKQLGNPSGHSSGALVTAISIFLDIFHGAQVGKINPSKHKFYRSCTYYSCLIFAIFYGLSMPYTRYFTGVHTLNQIIYGGLLGTWTALTMHFVFRDHIIKHIQTIIKW